jgi:hypothetical protein
MAASLIAVIKEEIRRSMTGDDRYYKSMPYYFKLITKANEGPVGPFNEALFPLPIAPEELEYEMPFALNVEPLQEGGVSVDRAGVVVGRLRIAGTTGWKMRTIKDTSYAAGNPAWTGLLPYEESWLQPISGQMHLWRLLGRCFDSYGELVKDPDLAPQTYLEWHNVKDQIHQLVEPRNVRITRTKATERVTYRYEITCDVIGQAERSIFDEMQLEDEVDLISAIRNTVGTIRKSIRQAAAAIDEITAAVDSIRRFVSDVAGIMDDVKAVIGAAEDFANGVKRFVDVTAEEFGAMATEIDNVGDLLWGFEEEGFRDAKIARRSFSELSDALDAIKVAAVSSMKVPFDQKADRHAQKVQRFGNMTDQEKAAASALKTKADSAGGAMPIQEAMGQNVKVGDEARIDIGDDKPGLRRGQWNGFREVDVTHGDTIFSLAIKHMGSATFWRDIVECNHLKPPYIATGARLPHTKAVGDTIVIPISKPVQPARVVATGDRADGASQAANLYGTDFRLTLLPNGHYGWLTDIAHGSEDVLTVSKVDNLIQGLENRCRNEQGEDLCFPRVGLPRVVGNNSIGETWMEARIGLHQQILADPRIEHISGMKFSVTDDVLTIDINARPVGYNTDRPIPLTIS